ncbi:PD-(D/E)XK nuclease family protein [Methylobacterium fujisawaense]|uniref:PD-(D/E)XK nuclease family protein n=1 Tax=Methylobacterium fujisawaense TaxID=107400 RepID=UPI00313CEE7D
MKILKHEAGRVTKPGLYQMPAAVYHADPAPEPSLSSSLAKVLLDYSPEHARAAHPRLAPPRPADEEVEDKPTRPREIGTAVHRLVLNAGCDLTVIQAPDYKAKDAQAARKAAYAANGAPILAPDLAKAERVAARVLSHVASVKGCEGFATAPAEVVAVLRDRSGAWLRTMMDRVEIHPTHAIIWDVKSSSQSSAPQGLGRRVEQMAMEVQAALYVHVLASLLPHLSGKIVFRWIFVEADEPNGVCIAQADGAGMEIGARKVAAAIHLWNRCRSAERWPGYPAEIVRVDFPEWAARRWSEREELDPQLAGVSYDVAQSPFRPLDMGDAA